MKTISNSVQEIASVLTSSGLKVTPQRVAVLAVLRKKRWHPTADEVFREVSQTMPGLSPTTVYNTLDALLIKGIIGRVGDGTDAMRYDPIPETHHHLFDGEGKRMEDYHDPELDRLISDYFKKKPINGFTIGRAVIHMTGAFHHNKK